MVVLGGEGQFLASEVPLYPTIGQGEERAVLAGLGSEGASPWLRSWGP